MKLFGTSFEESRGPRMTNRVLSRGLELMHMHYICTYCPIGMKINLKSICGLNTKLLIQRKMNSTAHFKNPVYNKSLSLNDLYYKVLTIKL